MSPDLNSQHHGNIIEKNQIFYNYSKIKCANSQCYLDCTIIRIIIEFTYFVSINDESRAYSCDF